MNGYVLVENILCSVTEEKGHLKNNLFCNTSSLMKIMILDIILSKLKLLLLLNRDK